jgi:hypothetical protein
MQSLWLQASYRYVLNAQAMDWSTSNSVYLNLFNEQVGEGGAVWLTMAVLHGFVVFFDSRYSQQISMLGACQV